MKIHISKALLWSIKGLIPFHKLMKRVKGSDGKAYSVNLNQTAPSQTAPDQSDLSLHNQAYLSKYLG